VDTLSKVLLAIMAVSALIQAVVILALALAGRRLLDELKELRVRVGKDLAPVMREVERITHNVAEVSETVAAQGRRVDEVVAATSATVRETTNYLGRAARKSVVPLIEIGAIWQGVKRAIQVYRHLRGSARRETEAASPALPPYREFGRPHQVWTEQQAGASDR